MTQYSIGVHQLFQPPIPMKTFAVKKQENHEHQTSKRILVVDSQPITRDTCLLALRTKGFDPMGAESTQVGLNAIQLEPPDLIICDANTNASGEISLVQALRTHPNTAIIPIVFLLTSLTRSALHKSVLIGVNACLARPIEAEELFQVVSSQLKKQAVLHEHYARSPAYPSALSSLYQISDNTDSPLSQALQFISDNHTQPIALSDVAQFVGYSPAYLTTQMKKQTGQTIQQWIIQLRMTTACSLLTNTNSSVEGIASQVGYQNTTHFFRQFRRLYGTTPQVWRNQRWQIVSP